jgi:hypothetical protein
MSDRLRDRPRRRLSLPGAEPRPARRRRQGRQGRPDGADPARLRLPRSAPRHLGLLRPTPRVLSICSKDASYTARSRPLRRPRRWQRRRRAGASIRSPAASNTCRPTSPIRGASPSMIGSRFLSDASSGGNWWALPRLGQGPYGIEQIKVEQFVPKRSGRHPAPSSSPRATSRGAAGRTS